MKKILCIHGLAAKPPQDRFTDFWKRSICKNLEITYQDNALCQQAEQAIQPIYWANAVPSHLEDSKDYCDALSDQIDQLIAVRKDEGNAFHTPKKWEAKKWAQKNLITLGNTLAKALSIKDNIVRKQAEEVRLYQNDQYVANQIREILIQAIIDAWNNGDEILILAHSMGTFIAYDVLWQLSHRIEYSAYHHRRVRRLITMGSPLGDDYIQSVMFGDRFRSEHRRFPANIESWINLSAYGDIVSHDSTLEDDFMRPMLKEGMLPTSGDAFRDYVKLWNPFITVSGEPNPHKSYGYLVQPKLATWIQNFLTE